MERTVQTKFWTYSQNNSGGYFVKDDKHGVCEYVIVEAIDSEDASDRLDSIGDKVNSFWDYCECCGTRWEDYLEDSDGTDQPMIGSKLIDEIGSSSYRERCFVHYFDKTFKEFVFEESNQ